MVGRGWGEGRETWWFKGHRVCILENEQRSGVGGWRGLHSASALHAVDLHMEKGLKR